MPGTSTKTSMLAARVPNDLLAALRKIARERGMSLAAVLVEKLREAGVPDSVPIRSLPDKS